MPSGPTNQVKGRTDEALARFQSGMGSERSSPIGVLKGNPMLGIGAIGEFCIGGAPGELQSPGNAPTFSIIQIFGQLLEAQYLQTGSSRPRGLLPRNYET